MKVIAKPFAPSTIGWLGAEEVLTVLALNVTPLEGVKFLLWSIENQAAVLFPSHEFEIVDGRLSRRWIFNVGPENFVFLAPELWQADEFWEKYHDDDVLAKQIFEEEKNLIFSEH